MNTKRAKFETSRRRRIQPHRQLLSVVAAAVVALAARSSMADHYIVPSGSMLPTVREGDRIFVNKLAYGFRLPFTQVYIIEAEGPHQGDVVVLVSPEGGTVLLKRVVAAPGDRVEIIEGSVILNGTHIPLRRVEGRLIEELGRSLHPIRISNGGGPDYGPTVIPEGMYLVMGDNRGDSHDSRTFGLVERRAILGRALGSFYSGGELTWRQL